GKASAESVTSVATHLYPPDALRRGPSTRVCFRAADGSGWDASLPGRWFRPAIPSDTRARRYGRDRTPRRPRPARSASHGPGPARAPPAPRPRHPLVVPLGHGARQDPPPPAPAPRG